MTLLALVKHSMPEILPALPARDWDLSDDGKSRCRWLADQLRELGVATLYSSVEARARQTAEIVGRHLEVDPLVLDGLQENDRTDFPYIRDEAELKQRFRDYFDNPTQLLIGRETANEALARFSEAVTKIVDRHPNENVGVVAHGTVISLFTASHNCVSPFQIWDSLSPLPAYLSCSLPSYEIQTPPKGFAG